MAKRRHIWDQLLAQAETPTFAISTDWTLVAFNEGCEKLTGFLASEVLGVKSYYGSSSTSSVESLVASLCPSPDSWGKELVSIPATIPTKNGGFRSQVLTFLTIKDESGAPVAMMGLIQSLPLPTRGAPLSPTQVLHAELSALRSELRQMYGEEAFIAKASSMRRIHWQLKYAIPSSVFVCLIGEQGAGRSHLARMIHYTGPQRANWFVPLDCRTTPPEELRSVIGRLLEIHFQPNAGRPQPGTVYLADVEYLPIDLQQALIETIVDPSHQKQLRLLCSSTRNLTDWISEGKLREDFAALISPLLIEIPPLRRRLDDIPLLAQHFLESHNRSRTKLRSTQHTSEPETLQRAGFAPEVWPLFREYDWPGNLAELQATITDALRGSTDILIRVEDLPHRFRSRREGRIAPPAPPPVAHPLEETLSRVEKQLISIALERSRGNKSKAAEILGINRAKLLRRLEQLGFEGNQEDSQESH